MPHALIAEPYCAARELMYGAYGEPMIVLYEWFSSMIQTTCWTAPGGTAAPAGSAGVTNSAANGTRTTPAIQGRHLTSSPPPRSGRIPEAMASGARAAAAW